MASANPDIDGNPKNESDMNLSKPLLKKGVYENPWPTWRAAGLYDVLKWNWTRKDNSKIPSDSKELDKTLPVRSVSDEELEKFCAQDTTNKIRVMWIGHATSLVNMDNLVFITDPVFSERTAPSQMIGPKRYRPVPFTIDRLPRLDAVLISHNHYDHLDYASVKSLDKRFGTKLTWFCGMGSGAWFRSCGIQATVHELTWWESRHLNNVEFVFTPAQHWCLRSGFDRNKSLWGSWTVLGPSKRFFFAGDTGYCSAFSEIGKKYGSFNLSTIPIGAYEPRWFMEPQHVDPAQAVQIHQDIKSHHSVGIHWGTFKLTDEFYLEPKSKLLEELVKAGLDKNSFITLEHGQIYEC